MKRRIIMNINFEKFLKDTNMTAEEYYKLNPSFKYLVDNYSITDTEVDDEEVFILKNGIAISKEEAIKRAENKFTFLKSLVKPTDELIIISLSRYPSAIKFLSEDKKDIYVELVIKKDPDALRFIENQTSELVDLALNIKPESLIYVNKEFRTYERNLKCLLECKNAHTFLFWNDKDECILDCIKNADVQNKLLQELCTSRQVPSILLNKQLMSLEYLDEFKEFLHTYKKNAKKKNSK